ncbi:MAG: bifunctional phosphoribosylaminoimidazolecarboxamide formyltransferase/IMP cyclohydrolase [Verrucomicrobiae bacterium]|nr:bifunctional phosphoribosylaminoimidazolecarboxamide formyltransferase/IMP cyclohydrolase [Verrucomicrobiae bacterium]
MKIQRALISVSDKTGIVELAKTIASLGAEILSTGGTAKTLRENGLTVKDVSDFTGFPEMMNGRVKTLHPKVHGGLLFLRGNPDHEKQAREHGIQPIDLVVVNLYPFENTVAKTGCTIGEAIEQIDIGGPSMLRSAAKNHASVTVIVDPSDYLRVQAELQRTGNTTLETRRQLAVKVFQTTSRYDGAIGGYLARQYAAASSNGGMPVELTLRLSKVQDLRYGENPHQKAALYGEFKQLFTQLHGKELSYNNILDLTAAVDLAWDFEEPTVAILKHNNPCGLGQDANLAAAWDKAFATDQQAPYGGIIAVNRELTLPLAEKISEIFSEVIVAPSFTTIALDLLRKKKNLRLIQRKAPPASGVNPVEIRHCAGGVLMQERDIQPTQESQWKVVTHRKPTEAEWRALRFGWRVVKHVKSNAIVFCGADRTLGIGAGQMSRVDSVKIAIWKSGEAKLSLARSAVASDAFFPFADGLAHAAQAGATAFIQPGGSVRDEDVIAAANDLNAAMVFTGRRHFRH